MSRKRPGVAFRRALGIGIPLLLLLAVSVGASDEGAVADRHVAAGGQLMFMRPADFGLAVHRDQVLVKSVIPPCDDGFDYCLYYFGDEFAGTNWESAGVRIERRSDLATAEVCLTTPPRGYVDLRPTVYRGDGFAVSRFAPLHRAAAGHYAEGELFRIALGDAACFEVETRIGLSRFEHYEDGTIRELKEADRSALAARLDAVVRAIRLVERPDVVLLAFPQAPANGSHAP